MGIQHRNGRFSRTGWQQKHRRLFLLNAVLLSWAVSGPHAVVSHNITTAISSGARVKSQVTHRLSLAVQIFKKPFVVIPTAGQIAQTAENVAKTQVEIFIRWRSGRRWAQTRRRRGRRRRFAVRLFLRQPVYIYKVILFVWRRDGRCWHRPVASAMGRRRPHRWAEERIVTRVRTVQHLVHGCHHFRFQGKRVIKDENCAKKKPGKYVRVGEISHTNTQTRTGELSTTPPVIPRDKQQKESRR